MNKSLAPTLTAPRAPIDPRLVRGLVVGLVAASIGALYTVFARWGIGHGMDSSDMTFLRFAVAGIVTLPVLALALRRDAISFLARWRVWLTVSVLAGPLFGLLMFTALQWAPASHAAVFPFTAMSVMGTLMSVIFLGDRLTVRKVLGIAIVVTGLLILSGLDVRTLSGKALLGDALFIAAGTLWAGFGIVMRKNKLDPLLSTATISFAALVTYVPAYLGTVGLERLFATSSHVVWVELLVQGLIAGAGTLYTYSKMVELLGPGRAAVFPALAPGIAALLAWPVLDHVPTSVELAGLVVSVVGLLITVTAGLRLRAR
ncbi:MAG: DMT family transporter [Rhizobiales bacterium]|nr:DMT family transporter [Rhizobacter sp.]